LAEYKPIINITHLPENFQRVQEITNDAHHFFNSTHLFVVYYEDLVTDSHVSLIPCPFCHFVSLICVSVHYFIMQK
jgi:hypothetical protein